MPSDLFEELKNAEPQADLLVGIRSTISRSLRPVRPLPSDSALLAVVLLGLFALIAIGTLMAGWVGLLATTPRQRLLYYGPIAIAAYLLARASISQMIPGSRSRVAGKPELLGLLGALIALVWFLFPGNLTEDFVSTGIPCLRLGLLCALPAAALTVILLRKGFVTDWIAAALSLGALSGIAGFGVLALHCPIQNSFHILVWHMGVIGITVVLGGAAGWAVAHRR